MPTTSSGRDSRRSSKSGNTAGDARPAQKGHRRENSSQYHATSQSARRGSLKPAEPSSGGAPARPGLQIRTYSAPLIEGRTRVASGPATGNGSDEARGEERLDSSERQEFAQGTGAAVEGGQDEDEVAGAVGAIRQFRPFRSPEVAEPLPELNIAVVGNAGVGKSTFVQNALGLPFPLPSEAAERMIPLEGGTYLVRLLELSIDDVDLDEDGTFTWPDTIGDKSMPRVDGAITLWDVTDKDSLEDIPEMLKAFSTAALPSVFISCKCDIPPLDRAVDPLIIERGAKRDIKHLDTLSTSAANPETHKRGLSMALSAVLARLAEIRNRSPSPSARRRSQSSAVRPVSPQPPSLRGHSRASSEYTGSLLKDPKHGRHDSSLAGYGTGERLSVPREGSNEDGMQRSFLIEESGGEESSADSSARTSVSDDSPQQQHVQSTVEGAAEDLNNGATFDSLVDQLLTQPTSKNDTRFVAIFLALYRKFAAPGLLLEAIVERYDLLDRESNAQMIRTVSQLRYLSVLEQWISMYPGDFAHPKTKRRMRTFVSKLAQTRIFAAAAKEMSTHLDCVHEDDDTDWECNDKDRETRTNDRRWTLSSTASTLIDDLSFVFSDDMTGTTLTDDAGIPSTMGTTDKTRTGSGSGSSSTSSSQVMINVETAQRQAQLLQPIPRQTLTKDHWRALMAIDDATIARELTRIDWIMFSSIRPRDLIRQVSLSATAKARCKDLLHVNRMIEHFNQLAAWAKNFILLRDKAKHRALILEKFMRIARKLRELNNYNALGAVIAGIKSAEVHRLNATRELIPQPVGKDWMVLEILMSPTRSHSSYRLAWENSSSERIPYLPLHLRDLVSAEQGNKTFVAGDEAAVNWKKFEIMGDVVVAVQKAQGSVYKGLGGVKGHEGIRELLLDLRLVKDEEELYERSLQCEPSAGSGGTARFREFFKR
ncbi:hypothetical protein MBLNU230_g8411t1 [Neophaeotheca triangularis]